MEVVGIVMSVAQTLFAALQNDELKEFMSVFGYKSQLEDLQDTVSTIKAVFEDAERKQTLSAVEQKLIQDLKDAVYEADDLLDEFITLAEQDQLIKADGSFSKKMRSFLSRTKPFGVAWKMSKGVKKIRKKLDAIIVNKQLAFEHDPEPIRKRRPESCSYVNVIDIIGRSEDLEKIIGMLLDSDDQQDPSFLGIYGIGGLGKTTLAQLVYNDPRVTRAFSLRLWTCVADQDQKQFNVEEVLSKTLASATGCKRDEGFTMDNLQRQLREELLGKRYLLVLDDVWTEQRNQWCDVKQYFVGGQKGSWIIVTTRSEGTATIVGGQRYKLKGLSKVDSWHLFQRTAFGSDESNPLDDGLDKLGREIVDECAGVPLAIRVIGSLLYGQDKRKWQSIKESGLANTRKSNDDIMSILQLSYHHLELPLKNCFSYCAMFPKDFTMDKEMLIDLWISQGYVVPLFEHQSVEDAGEECFSILLKRCFFQDIEKDENDKIVSCKMHDLMHDIAQKVAGNDICGANTSIEIRNRKVRHFSIPIWKFQKHCLGNTHIRSCILLGGGPWCGIDVTENSVGENLVSRSRGLRALSLVGLQMKSLPGSISILLHLRYLDLSYNQHLEVLPGSISKLYNLQFLKLKICRNLKELPKDLSKLVKLCVLDISGCYELKYMPRGMEKLTCLYKLTDFVVGSEGSFASRKQWFDGQHERKPPSGLKDKLRVHIKWPKYDDTEKYTGKGSVLSSTEHLYRIEIRFDVEGDGIMEDEGSIALMEILHPHPNLKELEIKGYNGSRMPGWISLFSNLVELHLLDCMQLKEWVGDASMSGMELPHLKGLKIENCPELTWIPTCPKLESLYLCEFNEELVFGKVGHAFSSTSCPKLKQIQIDNARWLNSLPMETFQGLELLVIKDDKLEKLEEVEKVLWSCSSSLQILSIEWCLYIELSMPCPSLFPSLHSINLCNLPKLKNLPSWMQFLPTLQTLVIMGCTELKAMPNWMPKLTSLKHLRVCYCLKSLERRCQKDPQGEDRPFIQHIPTISLECCDFGSSELSIGTLAFLQRQMRRQILTLRHMQMQTLRQKKRQTLR